MHDFASMSPLEVQFVRLYITTLKREYYLLRSTIDLMHPTNLGVKDFVAATRLATGLAEMQQDFDVKLRRLQKKNKLKALSPPAGPTLDELADLFSLSFFKVITTTEGTKKGELIKNNGWFSGKPTEWKNTLHSYKGVPKDKKQTLPDFFTDFFAAALKLFPFDNKTWLSEQSHNNNKKVWPPDQKKWHIDDDDDDDSNSNPFDWLFDDDED